MKRFLALVLAMLCMVPFGALATESTAETPVVTELPFYVTSYPETSEEAEIEIVFTGVSDTAYSLARKYRGVWFPALTAVVPEGEATSTFIVTLQTGVNDFVLYASDDPKGRDSVDKDTFTINYTPLVDETAPAPVPVLLAATLETRILRLWAEGNDVRSLQSALKDKGYRFGRIDGVYGPRTQAVVAQIQKKYGIKVDGNVGPDTYQVLAQEFGFSVDGYVAPTFPEGFTRILERDSYGDDVTQLQEALKTLGLYKGSTDKTYGYKTVAAVKAFQHRYALRVSGVANAATLSRVFDALGEAANVEVEVVEEVPIPVEEAVDEEIVEEESTTPAG